jgi:hypothetical protein
LQDAENKVAISARDSEHRETFREVFASSASFIAQALLCKPYFASLSVNDPCRHRRVQNSGNQDESLRRKPPLEKPLAQDLPEFISVSVQCCNPGEAAGAS